MRSRFGAVAVLCTAVAVSVTACSSSGSSSGSSTSSANSPTSSGSSAAQSQAATGGNGTYSVYAVEALSGPAAAYGTAAAGAVKAAVDVINAHGGVLGKKLTLTMDDDGGDPTKATTQLQAELTKGKPNLIVPGLLSAETAPLLPVIAKAGIFSVAPGNDASFDDPAKYPYHFSATPSGPNAAQAMIAEMKAKGYTKIGLGVTNDASGLAIVAPFQAAAKAAGITITSTIQLDPTAVDATSQLETLKSSNPQAVVFNMDGANNGVFLKGRTKLGWKIPFYSTIAGTSFNVGGQTSKADWNNVFLQAQNFLVAGAAGTKTPQFKTFSAALSKYITKIDQGMALYVNPYDPLLVWAAAANKAKSVDPKQVAAAVETLTNSSMVPNFVAQGSLYNGTSHFPDFAPSDFIYPPVGPTVNGLVKPAS